MIKACKLLNDHNIKYELILVGEGPEEGRYKTLISKYKIPNIVFKGPLTNKQVQKTLAGSSIFVLPCVISEDGNRDILANVLKEAMAMQIPVITSDICGIQELVEDGVSGILVPPKNPEAIADGIKKLLKNSKLRERMGKEGRKKIEKDFNIKTEFKKLEKIFQEVVNERKRIKNA